jgi:pimeloyl-ACP methyl ester carboxylesterase
MAAEQVVRFGPYRLDASEEQVWRGQELVKLTPKSFSVLRYLAERPKRLVTKEELFRALWPNTAVSDAALTRCIREIREALTDDARSPHYIETAHRRGFRFVGPPAEVRQPIPRTKTKYAKSGGVNIAYQVVGEGPVDLVMVPGWTSNVEGWWELPASTAFYERLATFCRLIIFDKRGTGMSDPFPLDQPPTLEQRMDDVRAVMDAAGFERAVLFGYSEGGPMSLLFAATYPERTVALVLHGTFAKQEWHDTFAARLAETPEQLAALVEERWSEGWPGLDVWAPTFAENEENRQAFARFMRQAASPATAAAILRMSWEIDVRPILPAIRVPTLILHRREERAFGVGHARYLADHIPEAKYVEMPGVDHLLYAGDHEAIAETVEEFLTGARRARKAGPLSTVLLIDVVDSAGRAGALGDRAWRNLLERHQTMVRKEVSRFRGREAAGDQWVATFDGPIRALRCALRLREILAESRLQIRAGVHTGECEFQNDRLNGTTVRIAAQILAEAAPGEIWVSGTTKDLVPGSGIEFEDRGLHVLGDIPRQWPLFIVKSTDDEATRRSRSLPPSRLEAKSTRGRV